MRERRPSHSEAARMPRARVISMAVSLRVRRGIYVFYNFVRASQHLSSRTILNTEPSSVALQRPGDICVSYKLSMRETLIPARWKRFLNAAVMLNFTLTSFLPSLTADLEVDVFEWLTFYCAFSEEAVIENLGWVKNFRLPTPVHLVDDDPVFDGDGTRLHCLPSPL